MPTKPAGQQPAGGQAVVQQAPAGPTLAEKLAMARRKLDWAKSWPEDGDEREAMIAKAQKAVTEAQAELNAARPLGTQIKSATDKVEAHTKSVASIKEALEAAKATVEELEGNLLQAQDALATAEAEHQALVKQADKSGPLAQATIGPLATKELLRTLMERSQDPQVTAILGTWMASETRDQPTQEASGTEEPPTGPATGAGTTEVGSSAAGRMEHKPAGPTKAQSAGMETGTRPAKRPCVAKSKLQDAGLPKEIVQAIIEADAKGVPPELSSAQQIQVAAAAAAANLEPHKADLAEALQAAAEAANITMADA